MSDTTIDTILEDFFHPPQPPSDTVKIVYKPIDPKYYKELKSALYDLILKEVVGEDDKYNDFCKECSDWDDGRNDLKAKQRDKLKQLFERSDNDA